VNADSLAGWFAPVLGGLAAQDVMNCEILRHDEAHSTELLRSGQVMGAVTTKDTPIQGCSSVYLGTMRYQAMASSAFMDRWFPGDDPETELEFAPMVSFDRTDDLQRALRRRIVGNRIAESPAEHFIPDSRVYVAAVAASLGWGMIPEVQDPRDGSLVSIDETWTSTVPLYWQRWKVPSVALDLLTGLVLDAAETAGLRQEF
jgi:LysR family transcriptional regulator (chromosome initiation inhibitor)